MKKTSIIKVLTFQIDVGLAVVRKGKSFLSVGKRVLDKIQIPFHVSEFHPR